MAFINPPAPDACAYHLYRNRTYMLAALAAALVVVLSYPLMASFDHAVILAIGAEDALVENIGAGAYLVSAVILFGLYVRSRKTGGVFCGRQTRGNIYFLLLGALFFVCAGEEISWGQRIFNWDTPALLMEHNAQRETNLHNLTIFQASDDKSPLAGMLNMTRLLSLFFLAYCFVFPLAFFCLGRVRRLQAWAGVPVPALIGAVPFAAAYIAFRVLYTLDSDAGRGVLSAYNELKESNLAVAVLVLSCGLIGEASARSLNRPA